MFSFPYIFLLTIWKWKWNGYLIGESYTDTEQNPTNNEHGHIDSSTIDGRTCKEGGAAE